MCQFLLYSLMTHSYLYIHSLSYSIFHYGLSQETGYSSLCYTVGCHCLSILNVIVCIYQPPVPHPSHFFAPHPWHPQVCSLHPWVCFCFVGRFICAIFWIPHISDIVWYVSFSFWITSLSTRISRCIHVAANGIFVAVVLSSWVVFHCTYVPHLLNPFICW